MREVRLIEIGELKEWIEGWFKMNKYYHPYATSNNIPIPELYDILEKMPTIDPVKTMWIDVNDRLPNTKETGMDKIIGLAKREYERIKELRTQLHLSQDYVAKYLGINRSTYTQMENGNRKVLADEVAKLSELFGVTTDSLLNNTELSQPATMFARSFKKLDERDQAEIMNLIRFKEQINKK